MGGKVNTTQYGEFEEINGYWGDPEKAMAFREELDNLIYAPPEGPQKRVMYCSKSIWYRLKKMYRKRNRRKYLYKTFRKCKMRKNGNPDFSVES